MLYDQIELKTQENKSTKKTRAMVASARYEASSIGVDVLKKGGNAIDAAVAVGLALAVCEPNASGLGGGGFMTIFNKSQNVQTFIDFRECAPENAKPSMWTVVDGVVVGNQKAEGGKAVCVPGEIAGLLYAHESYGKLSFEELIQPAIDLAEGGIEVTRGLYQDLIGRNEILKKYSEEGNPFLNGQKPGEVLLNPNLANTLKVIKKEKAKGFYEGAIAEQLVESINKFDGVFQLEDLKKYKPNEMKPIVGSYKGYEIASSPLPSSGGTHVIQILNILEALDISQYAVNSFEYIHILSEVFKMCFADRQVHMGDPNFSYVPIEGLTSKSYAKDLSEKVEMDQVKSYECDDPKSYESTDTTHFSIVDQDGNMVSCTKTISAFFGSCVVPKNTGVVLNCQTRGFLIGEGKSNSIGPGKKPLSSMSPTIITKDGKPFAVLGTPGGNRIITTMVQMIIKLIDYNMSMEEAIDSPRISNDMKEILHIEGGIDIDVVDALRQVGHEVETHKEHDRKFGGVQGILCTESHMEGAADPRRDGVAIGY